MKTSLTAPLLFHLATCSLGQDVESPQGDLLTPKCSMLLLVLPLLAHGLFCSCRELKRIWPSCLQGYRGAGVSSVHEGLREASAAVRRGG